jgi:branched-chain amino acid transport system ATP-binding protein
MTALTVTGLTVLLTATAVVDDVSLTLDAGEVVGLIGPNGAGKTTLIDALTGFTASTGEVRLGGRPLDDLPAHARARRGLARTFQSLELFEDLSVAEHVRVAGETAGRGGDDATVLEVLELTQVADQLPAALSHAQRKALALARALVTAPDVLLLDEPAAGLDGEERSALQRQLRRVAAEGVAVLLVDHDMGLVLDTCDRVVVLHQGAVLAQGRPDEVRSDPRVLAAYLGDRDVVAPTRGARPGAPLLVVDGLTAGYAGVPVLTDVSLQVRAGEVVALLGRNGAGKTTLLSALAGLLRPTAGEVTVLGGGPARPERLARRGLTLLPQGRGLFLRLTGAENLRLAGSTPSYDEVLQHFPELPPLLGRPAGTLSGGQQQQLALARALLTRPRLLLVDELSMGLAPQVVDELLAAVRRAADEHGAGVLVVEQHVPLALSVADRGYVLERGRVAMEGPAGDLAGRPELVRASYLG